MALADFKRLEPLKRYTANDQTFGQYPSSGDVYVNADFAYTEATKDFKMTLRAQTMTSDGANGVTISANIVADSDYTGIFEVKPPKALFMGTWATDNEHYSSTVEGCDTQYTAKEGIYWRTKNGYNIQMSKNFNSIAPVTDAPLNNFFYYLGGDSTSPNWSCNVYKRNPDGTISFNNTQTLYLYTLMDASNDTLDLMVATSIPTTSLLCYYWDTDNKWHSYYRPYYGTFLLWETTDGRLQNICRLADPPIQMCSRLNGERSSINLFSVPRADGTGVVPLRPYFPDGYYANGVYENDFALLVVENGVGTYYLKMSFLKKIYAYSGMRFMSSYGNNTDFRRNSSSSTGFEYKPVGGTSVQPFTPDSFVSCSRSAIGEINDKGLATGHFITYSELQDYHGINMQPDYRPNNSGYKPETYISDEDDIDDMTIGSTSYNTGFVRYYQTTISDLDAISAAISNQHDYTDMSRNIVSIKSFVLPTSRYIQATRAEDVIIGRLNTARECPKIIVLNSDYVLGSYTINGKFGSYSQPHFLDKSPYTQIEVYIPYCGTIQLPDTCMYKTIQVHLVADILSGSCLGVVKCDGNVIAEKSGICGIDTPITSEDNALKSNAMISGVLNSVPIASQTAAAAITGNAGATISGAVAALQNVNNMRMAEQANYTRVVGSTGSRTENALPDTCYIKIYRPIVTEAEDYAHKYGKPCNKKLKLSDCDGFTQCYNPTINGKMTKSEKDKIISLLSSGVYL